MNRVLAIVATLASLTLTAGCHAQPAPTPGYQVQWTWTAPTSGSCTSACQYIVSTLAVATGTSTCPAATGQYVPQQTAATALTGTSWTQPSTTGTLQCAVVSTYYSGATSNASAVSNVVTSPALPLAPGPPSGTEQVAKAEIPERMTYIDVFVSQNLAAPSGITGTAVRR